MDDNAFLDAVADRLATLPTVTAVTLGGSRAQRTHRPDSDWDLAIYYRGDFDPQHLREIGWDGEVSDVGAWSPGVFNGGAWLRIDERPVDLHYRDLDVVERELSAARAGRFHLEPLQFHLAGIPSYLVVGELAIHRVLRGELPRPEYPDALRATAPGVWWASADLVLSYARANHAPYGRVAQCGASITQAALQSAHAVLAARGEWVTNEKPLLARAGLGEIDTLVAALRPDSETLGQAVVHARALCERAIEAASRGQ